MELKKHVHQQHDEVFIPGISCCRYAGLHAAGPLPALPERQDMTSLVWYYHFKPYGTIRRYTQTAAYDYLAIHQYKPSQDQNVHVTMWRILWEYMLILYTVLPVMQNRLWSEQPSWVLAKWNASKMTWWTVTQWWTCGYPVVQFGTGTVVGVNIECS